MASEVPHRWIVLRVERERSALKISARDDRGRKRSGVAEGKITQRGKRRVVRFTLPASIVELIGEALADLPSRAMAPILLPLFLELGPRLRKEADTADPGLPKDLAQRVRTVEPAPQETRRPHRPLAKKGGGLRAFSFETTRTMAAGLSRGRSLSVPVGVKHSETVVWRPTSRARPAARVPKATPKVTAEMRERQERRVNIALQSLESSPVRAIKPDRTLRRSGLYRLRVQIGQRSKESLVVGEAPGVDSLLPPAGPKGHTLDVVVYEKDFSLLLSSRVQTLRLPETGGSEPVYFDLRAPERKGKARLRVKVYYRNQLLQSFLLEAVIADQEQKAEKPSPALRVDLAYSRTARFTNLEVFKERALSIGVNQDPEGGSHLFMFKVGKAAEAIDVSEKILDEQIGKFRKLLQDATVDAKGRPRFPTALPPVAPPGEDFYQVIRDLAEAGSNLYDALLVRLSPALEERFQQIARSADGTLQIMRDDPSYVFPWSILYDFGLPERIVGGPPAPVCLGGEEGKPCAHGPGDDVYCVRGFWGIRHALEILMARGGVTEDEVTAVEREAREGAVCLATGAQDEPTQLFVAEMEKSLGTGIRVIGGAEDVLDLLWDEQRRPALLIVLGHLETEEIVGEPPGPRIVLAPKKKWLRAKAITARERKAGEWRHQPRSVVLLMACGSGATEVSTLNDFVTSLSSAGAAAVVGTECLVFTKLVTLFAREVTGALWSGKVTLGEAIKNLRRRLVSAGNPLAFVFSAAGNADLVFHLKG